MLKIISLIVLLINSNFLSANVMWPGLVWEASLFNSLFIILFGFIFELIIIKMGTNLNFKQSLFITFWMNLASIFLGAIFLPLINFIQMLIFAIFPESIQKPFYVNPLVTWINVGILATLINIIIESFVFLKKYPKFDRKKIIIIVSIANIASNALLVFNLLSKK